MLSIWQYTAAYGPVVSTWQSSWTLLLSKSGITAYPYSFRETLNLYGKLQYGEVMANDPHASIRTQILKSETPTLDESRVKQFPIITMTSIVVEKNWFWSHSLTFTFMDQEPVRYRLAERETLETCFYTFKSIYGDLVKAKGFEPQTTHPA